MNRVLLAIGGLLVGLLALLFAAPAMVDWNRYRGIFEEEASRFLGREVRVGGRVNLRLLPVPFVRFEKVRVADTTANVGRPLFMADDFTVWLSIGALLGGGLEATEIELRKPVVTLVLDGKGGGSWSSLATHSKGNGQAPLRIALNAVRITNGTIAVLGTQGEARAQIEFINGELSAQALEGPYKIAAAFAAGGAPREIRLSTAKPGEDGAVRFKGTVRDPASGVSYSLDGHARDVLDKLKVAGELTARLPLPAALAGRTAGKAAGEFDVRAELKGDTSGFTLADLALSFEQAGRPQMATGGAKVNWGGRSSDVAITLKSHWLDLDRIAGGEKAASPLQMAWTLADSLGRVLGGDGRTEATLSIDQATFGGDVASDLTATLEQTGGKLAIRNLSAALPGGARLTATGTFEKKQDEQQFEGQISLRGASLTRFLGWAARGQSQMLPASDSAFAVVGAVTHGTSEIAGRNLTVQIGRNTLTGEASWKAGKPDQIVLNLDGSELDVTPLIEPNAEPVRGLKGLIAKLAGGGDKGKPAGPPGTAAAGSDAEIRLRVDRLVAGKTVFRDAVTELKLTAGNLAVSQIKLASDDGYAIEIRGDIAGLAQPGAKGTLTGLATAERAEGVVALARHLGLPADLLPTAESGAMAAPLRLAGRVGIGGKGPDTADIAIDGTVSQSRVAGTLRLGPEAASWRERTTDLAMTIEGRDLPRLVARLTGASAGGAASAAAPAPGATAATPASATPAVRLDLRGIGNARGGIAALGTLDGEGTNGEYRGRVSLDDTGALTLDGELTVALADIGRGLALAGLGPRPALAGPVAGSVRIARSGGRLQLSTTQLKLAGGETAGTLAIEATGENHRVQGDLKIDAVSLPGLMAALTTGSGAARGGQRGDGASPWSEAPLDLAPLERLTGSRLRIEAGRVALAPGIDLTEAKLEVTARAGGLDVRLAESKALGGRAEGMLAFEKAQAGVRLAVEGRLGGGRLDAFTKPGGPPAAATGGIAATIKAQGTALTPRGLVVALAGSGEIALEQARLTRWTPTAIGSATEAVLAIKGELPPGVLRQQLEAALRAGGVPIGGRRLNLTIADGALQTAALVATLPRGRVTGRGAVDLDSLKLDGEWRLEPLNTPQPPGAPPKPELPAIIIAYTGPAAGMSGLEPRIDSEALEREVAVRKVEREVAELERLRKLDEERSRQEAERLEAEKREAERLLGEQRRLELQAPPGSQVLPLPPPGAPDTKGQSKAPTPVAPATHSGPVPVTTPGGGSLAMPAAGGQAPEGSQAGALPIGAAPNAANPIAAPPTTIELAPLPRPAEPAGALPPAKTRARSDPFRALRESP